MPLPKQNLFLPVGGLRGDVDDRLLPAGHALELENYYLPKLGRAEKRFGTTPLPIMAGASALGTHQNALVALTDGADPIKLLPTSASAAWVGGESSSGPIAGPSMPTLSVGLTKVAATRFNSAGNITSGTVAYGSGYYFVAYLDAGYANKLHLSAVEVTTGHIVSDYVLTLVGVTIAAWKVKFVAGHAVVAYETSAGAVNFIAMNASTFGVNLTNGGVVSLGGTYHGERFDMMVKDASTVSVVYPNAAGNARCLDFVPSPAAVTPWTPQSSAGADISIAASAGWMQDFGTSGKIALIAGTVTNINVHWDIPTAGATRQAVSSYAFTPASSPWNVTGHTTTSSATGEFVVVWDNNFGGIGSTTGWVGLVSRLGGVLTNGPILYRGATLRSKTFTYLGTFYAVISFASSTQGTHYLVKIPTVTDVPATAPYAAIFAVRFGRGGAFSDVASPQVGTFSVATSFVSRYDGGANHDAQGIQLATFKFPTSRPVLTVGTPRETIGSMFVPGAHLRRFDGASYVEAGFAYGPEQPTLTPGAAGAGLTENSDYWCVVTYSAFDAQGRLWRSSPSVAKMVSMGAGQRQLTWDAPTLRLTGMANVQVEFWRGVADEAEVLQKAGVVANNIAADTVSFVDTVTDTDIVLREFLYTTDGILPNQTPPGFIAIAVAQNCLWGISQDDPQVLWRTKEFTLDQGLGWHERMTLDVRDEHGPLRGIAVVDDKVVLVKDRMTYTVIGTGWDNRGENSTYKVQIVSPGIGCPSGPRALCEYRDGIMFPTGNPRSPFAALDRGLTMHPLGGIQDYNGLTVVGAIYVPKLAQARFYTESGTTLVYDVVNQQWSVNTGQPAYAAVSWSGVPTYVNGNADRVLIEDLTGATYTENGVAYGTRISFPWVQVNQIKGYEHFWQVLPVGELIGSQQNLTVTLYRDFSALSFHAKTANVGTADINVALKYSTKLSAIRVMLQDGAAGDAGFAIDGVTLQVAAKAGVKRSVTRMT